MTALLRCCNGTYVRDADGWHYPWGEPVAAATDLTLADLMAIDDDVQCAEKLGAMRPLTPPERRWLAGESSAIDQVLLRRRPGHRPNAGDLIVGMMATELHALTMMTVSDIAEVAGVSKATVDSYRYRGYLPAPQIIRGRTPLWARPIVHHWLRTRPGSGWRSDIYPAAAPDGGDGRARDRATPVMAGVAEPVTVADAS